MLRKNNQILQIQNNSLQDKIMLLQNQNNFYQNNHNILIKSNFNQSQTILDQSNYIINANQNAMNQIPNDQYNNQFLNNDLRNSNYYLNEQQNILNEYYNLKKRIKDLEKKNDEKDETIYYLAKENNEKNEEIQRLKYW